MTRTFVAVFFNVFGGYREITLKAVSLYDAEALASGIRIHLLDKLQYVKEVLPVSAHFYGTAERQIAFAG